MSHGAFGAVEIDEETTKLTFSPTERADWPKDKLLVRFPLANSQRLHFI